jgi:RDD family
MGYPNLLRRYLATFIDFWVMLFLLYTYAHSGFYHEEISKLPLWPLLIFVLYEPFLTRYLCTPGQYLMHFRVRMVSDHGRVPLWPRRPPKFPHPWPPQIPPGERSLTERAGATET